MEDTVLRTFPGANHMRDSIAPGVTSAWCTTSAPFTASASSSVRANEGPNNRSDSSIIQPWHSFVSSRPDASVASLDLPVLGQSSNKESSSSRLPSRLSLDDFRKRYTKLSRKEVDEWLWNNRTVVTAGTASLISTTASFPVREDDLHIHLF